AFFRPPVLPLACRHFDKKPAAPPAAFALLLIVARIAGPFRQEAQRRRKMDHALRESGPLNCLLSRTTPIGNCMRGQSRLSVVISNQFGLGLDGVRELLF